MKKKIPTLFDARKAHQSAGAHGQEVRKVNEAPDAYAVPKKRKPGQRKLNADTDDQAAALEALAAIGIKDAILPAISVAVETSNAVLEALDEKHSWATAREEGAKANEFWTEETVRVRDDNRKRFLDLAEARVRELEGLRVLSRDIGTITLLLDQDLSTVPPLTLGEAMPRKEGV